MLPLLAVREAVLSDDDLLAEILANDLMSRADVCKRACMFCAASGRCNDEKLWRAIATKMGIEHFMARELRTHYLGEDIARTYRALVNKWCRVIRDQGDWQEALWNAIREPSYDRMRWIVDNGDPNFKLHYSEIFHGFAHAAESSNVDAVQTLYMVAKRSYPDDEKPKADELRKMITLKSYYALRPAALAIPGAGDVLAFFKTHGYMPNGSPLYRGAFGQAYDNRDLRTLKYMVNEKLVDETLINELREVAARWHNSWGGINDAHIAIYEWLLTLV